MRRLLPLILFLRKSQPTPRAYPHRDVHPFAVSVIKSTAADSLRDTTNTQRRWGDNGISPKYPTTEPPFLSSKKALGSGQRDLPQVSDYQRVREVFLQGHHLLTEDEQEAWTRALRMFQVARVASWQVAAAEKGASKYLRISGVDDAKRFREAEQRLWEEWDEHVVLADEWASAHNPTLEALRSCKDSPSLEAQREALSAQFETGTGKAVVAMAFEDWRDSLQPKKARRRNEDPVQRTFPS